MSLARPWALAASIALPIGLPLLAFGGLFTQHFFGYHGTCGPYALDIDAYPCDRSEYLANFFGGFDLLGLLVILAAAFVLGVALVVAAWACVGVAYLLGARGAS